MSTHRQRRRVQNGVFAAGLFLAAIGLLALVWMSVRGIPQEEASRVGRLELRLLRQAIRTLDARITHLAYLNHHVLAALPSVVAGNVGKETDAALDAALTELEAELGASGSDSFVLRRYDAVENGVEIYPPGRSRLAPPMDSTLIRELVRNSRRQDHLKAAFPLPLRAPQESGRSALAFVAPIYKNVAGKQQFEGALVLFVSSIGLLRDSTELLHLRPQSYSFVLSWDDADRNSAAVRPQLLWHSAEAQEETSGGREADWQKALTATLCAETSVLREDARDWSLLLLPTRTDNSRLEVVAHFNLPPIFGGARHWALCLSTPFDSLSENVASQRLLLIALGSVAIGILSASVLFFLFQIWQRERELKAVEASYEGLFAENPTAMMVLNERGEMLDCNFSAARLTGLAPHDAIGTALTEMFEPSQGEQFRLTLADQGNLHAQDVKWTRLTDGAPLVVEIWGRRIGDRWILMANDVGQRRDFEKQVARLKRMDSTGSLASTLAHDFNNLLGQIQILVSNLRTDAAPDSELFQELEVIENKVEDASQLVADILAFRESVLSGKPVWLEPVLREFVNNERKLLPPTIEVNFEIRGELPSVWMAPQALRRVLDNLCRNAADAMPYGGSLTIRCFAKRITLPAPERLAAGDYAIIEVADTGTGMSETTLEKLFEPFFTTKEGGRGTGLGLWTVYKILRQLGGGIHVHSQPGKGTRFEILLPHDPPGREHRWIRREARA